MKFYCHMPLQTVTSTFDVREKMLFCSKWHLYSLHTLILQLWYNNYNYIPRTSTLCASHARIIRYCNMHYIFKSVWFRKVSNSGSAHQGNKWSMNTFSVHLIGLLVKSYPSIVWVVPWKENLWCCNKHIIIKPRCPFWCMVPTLSKHWREL